MKRALVLILALATAACGDAVETAPEPAEPFVWPAEPGARAVLHVKDRGTIEIALFPQLAPVTVESFVRRARAGFYEGTTFHRVIPGFMIQGGDPNSKDRDPTDDGKGGTSDRIPDEFSDAPHTRGAVSMANLGLENSGDCQFFIVHRDAPHLDGKYAVFGRVVKGMDVVDAITEVEVDLHGRWGPKNRPIENVVVERIEVRPAKG